jgi:hypothetical protein
MTRPFHDLLAGYRAQEAEILEAVRRVLESGHYILGREVGGLRGRVRGLPARAPRGRGGVGHRGAAGRAARARRAARRRGLHPGPHRGAHGDGRARRGRRARARRRRPRHLHHGPGVARDGALVQDGGRGAGAPLRPVRRPRHDRARRPRGRGGRHRGGRDAPADRDPRGRGAGPWRDGRRPAGRVDGPARGLELLPHQEPRHLRRRRRAEHERARPRGALPAAAHVRPGRGLRLRRAGPQCAARRAARRDPARAADAARDAQRHAPGDGGALPARDPQPGRRAAGGAARLRAGVAPVRRARREARRARGAPRLARAADAGALRPRPLADDRAQAARRRAPAATPRRAGRGAGLEPADLPRDGAGHQDEVIAAVNDWRG